jgi:septal ring factor EnvC (AmiA/AmiB activator)
MAEAIGLAASVIAVLQLSDQVIRVTRRYIAGVRSAKSDIQAFEKEVSSLKRVLEELEAFLKQTEKEPTRLSATRGCESSLDDCHKTMESIFQTLKTKAGKAGKAGKLERFSGGIFRKELFWPFQKEEVESLITLLSGRRATIQFALTLDST